MESAYLWTYRINENTFAVSLNSRIPQSQDEWDVSFLTERDAHQAALDEIDKEITAMENEAADLEAKIRLARRVVLEATLLRHLK